MRGLPVASRSMLLALGVASFTGCGPNAGDNSPNAGGSHWFDDYTPASGVQFVHEVETSGRYLFSEVMGSGGAFVDYDNDGRLDVYLIHNVSPSRGATNRLFHQEASGRFIDATPGSGLETAGYGNGLAVGDLNNDGLPEILITEYDRVRLFLNQGSGRFSEVSVAAGITNRLWSVAAAFFDYDRDGWLDLVIGNYLDFDPSQRCPDAQGRPEFCGPHGFHSTITRLFRNVSGSQGPGAGLKFVDATVSSGLARAPGKAMGILCADFNGDHWPDLFITDDALPNRLFLNQRNGTFVEEAVARGVAYTGTGAAAANMGIAIGDVDGDGRFDLFVPHLTDENHTLWRQTGDGTFQDDTARAGLLGVPWHGTGFGAVFGDFDRNGTIDLAVVNGLVRRRPGRSSPRLVKPIPSFWVPYAEPSQLFANQGNGRFAEISGSNPALCSEAMVGRGLICGDIDNDGRLDLLVTGIGSAVRLLRNVSAGGGHWLGIRAIDPALGGRDAYGAEVRVHATGHSWWRLVQPAYSYASSNDPRGHFGLGQVAQVDRIEILWPDGLAEKFTGGAVDGYRVLRRGSGQVVNQGATPPTSKKDE